MLSEKSKPEHGTKVSSNNVVMAKRTTLNALVTLDLGKRMVRKRSETGMA